MNRTECVDEVYQKWKTKWLEHLKCNKFVLLLEDESVNTYLQNFNFRGIEVKNSNYRGENITNIKITNAEKDCIERTFDAKRQEAWEVKRFKGETNTTDEDKKTVIITQRVLFIKKYSENPLFHVFESFPWTQMYKDVISCYGKRANL